MARFLVESAPQPFHSWIEMVWGLLVLSLLGFMMARTMGGPKRSVQGGGEGSSHGGGDEQGKGKKRKKTTSGRTLTPFQAKEAKSKAQKKWEATFVKRSATCERQVDRKDIGESPIIERIIQRGLKSLFNPVVGYIKPLVVEFYAKIQIEKDTQLVWSTVRGKRIEITPDRVADYLGYTRPEAENITFPLVDNQRKFDLQELVQEMYVNPADFNGTFMVGRMKDDYRLLNKILHYNIFPRGVEKQPATREVELLHAFMDGNEEFDVAYWIWKEISDFRTETMVRASMPYPHMITKFCQAAKVKLASGEKYREGKPGPITKASISKSRAMSKSLSAAPSSFQPKGKRFQQRVEEWLNYICGRVDNVAKEQKILKKEQRRQKQQLEFCVNYVEEKSGNKFQPVEEEDDEEDEEAEGGPYESDEDDE